MRLSALEIKKKEFQQKMRGCDPEEVQAFLDQASMEVETLGTEKKELEDALMTARERLEHYTALEQTIEKTLAAAQQTAVTMTEQAKREAELILREAEIERSRKLNDGRMENERVERALLTLRTEYDVTLARMRSLLSSFSTFVATLERDRENTSMSTNGIPSIATSEAATASV
ncbi:MAG: DivIVA domain-containing protein [Bacteroidota bacterium]|nr:DivIVA domain-containing protein [Bacteroidota bacterium]MDP4233453.1 DivIVA domain-containing protein [Bacteroidota bacterium]MDP4242319.1 DivIVA domain-containing protein [Bacteroidota bacterium]MDP4287075.1 DivIVA domain-containing protein [Bacteroidota bacterium]